MIDRRRGLYPQAKPSKQNLIASLPIYFVKEIVAFVLSIPQYFYWRLRMIGLYLMILATFILEVFSNIKTYFIRRMFWGRGGLYKSSFHIIIIAITMFILVTNLSGRFSLVPLVEAEEELVFSYAAEGNKDLLQQGNTLQSIVAIDPGFPEVTVKKYTVKKNDTLKSIANEFHVSLDTVKWANNKIISPFDNKVEPGWVLDIPEMNGVLYTVAGGDNLDSIVRKTGGDKASIIELNRLAPPQYRVKNDQKLFIPEGKLKPPQQPRTVVASNPGYQSSSNDYSSALSALKSMPGGTFGNPLARCPGYRYSRGLSGYHNGVDLSKGGGCPVVASAAGKVTFVGWHSLSGFHVIIDHGSGIRTHYFHAAAGTFKVSSGQHVAKGQQLFWMGCTGRCTGTHLHFELFVGGRYLDPGKYVPY